MLCTAYVPTAEAAYIAGVSDRQLQRLFDELDSAGFSYAAIRRPSCGTS